MAYIGPMAGFHAEKKDRPECPALFEEITAHKSEEWQHVREEHLPLLIKYIDAYGEVLQKGAKIAEAIRECANMSAKLAPEIQRIREMRQRYSF